MIEKSEKISTPPLPFMGILISIFFWKSEKHCIFHFATVWESSTNQQTDVLSLRFCAFEEPSESEKIAYWKHRCKVFEGYYDIFYKISIKSSSLQDLWSCFFWSFTRLYRDLMVHRADDFRLWIRVKFTSFASLWNTLQLITGVSL